MQRCRSLKFAALCAFGTGAAVAPRAAADPFISTPFAGRASVIAATPAGAAPTASQMAWGPDGRLYVARAEQEIFSYAYNPATGQLTDARGTGVSGMGVAFARHAVPDG